MRADVNVIDMQKLRIHRPEAVADLPSGATRWIQRCSGYTMTICNGVVTVRDNQLVRPNAFRPPADPFLSQIGVPWGLITRLVAR